jgi:hypothetical protein
MMPWDKTTGAFVTSDGIAVEDVHSDYGPAFERCYTIKLDDRATLRVAIKTSCGRRYANGELKQPDAKWVVFDPRNIAEKIIDRTLVPLVEKACATIMAEDAKFARHLPDIWTDKEGHKWQRIR